MGDSVSLELVIKDSDEASVLANILPILIRKAKKVKKSNGDIKIVPDSFKSEEYGELKKLFSEGLMVGDVINLKTFF